MKKTLAVAAVLAAFAGSAAADVTVYGRADVGFNFNGDTNTLTMKTGQSSGNRWGLMGSEKISENLTVGFQLEAGFNVDDGVNATYNATKKTSGNRTFHRESRVFVGTEYGTFHFGRMGTLSSGAGSVSIADNLTVFGTGYGAFSGDMTYILDTDTRRDNVVTYQSPKMAGATVYAQVASDETEGWAQGSERYYAAAVEYKAGAFSAGLVASVTDGKTAADAVDNGEHKMQFVAGVGYDFGVAAVKLTGSFTDYENAGEDNYGVLLGVSAPVAGGTFDVQVGYGEGYYKVDDVMTKDVERLSAAAMYQYPLSKKTSLYVGTGYVEEEVAGTKSNKAEYFAGMLHKF